MRALGAPWAASFVAAESQVGRGSLKGVGSPLCRLPCCNQSGDHDCDREYMSHLLLLGKFEYGGGPIFKVVLEC